MVRTHRVLPALGLLALAGMTVPAGAQDASSCFVRGATHEAAAERPSPLTALNFQIGDGTVNVCYGAPSARDRTVFGELVPLGTPWRLGANEATSIELPFDGTIGDVAVSAGTYAIYAIPGAESWEIVVNGNHERWGIPITDAVRADDVGSFTRPVQRIENHVETMTIGWMAHGEGSGHLVVEWENTRVEIPVHRGSGHGGHDGHAGHGER